MIIPVNFVLCDQDGCTSQFPSAIGVGVDLARREAYRTGWVSLPIYNGLGRVDYCPEHAPA